MLFSFECYYTEPVSFKASFHYFREKSPERYDDLILSERELHFDLKPTDPTLFFHQKHNQVPKQRFWVRTKGCVHGKHIRS